MWTRTMLAWMAGLVAMFATNAVMAVAVIGPLLEDGYAEVVATNPRPVALVGGYALIAVVLVVVHRMATIGRDLRRGLMVGGLLGLGIFAGSHMVQVGYTTLDPFGWIVSGVLDAAGPTVGMAAISLVAPSRLTEGSVAP